MIKFIGINIKHINTFSNLIHTCISQYIILSLLGFGSQVFLTSLYYWEVVFNFSCDRII